MRYVIGKHVFWSSETSTAAVRLGRQYWKKGRLYHYLQRIEAIRRQVFHICLTEIDKLLRT